MPPQHLDQIAALISPWTGPLVTFALVLCRVGGMLSVGPLLGRSILPWPVRIGLALALTLLLAPLAAPSSLTTSDVATFVVAVAAEACTGFMLGAGSMLILWILPLAGQLLDQQHGLPPDQDDTTPITHWLTLWGTAAFLLCSPINGHVQAVTTLADSFQLHPIGSTMGLVSSETASRLLQQSCQLALLLIAPALASMTLINLALGFLSSAGLSSCSTMLSNPTRAITAAVVLALNLSGIQQIVVDFVRDGMAVTTQVP